MATREVDLVIRDEEDMLKLIALVTYSIKTLDNEKKTAEPML